MRGHDDFVQDSEELICLAKDPAKAATLQKIHGEILKRKKSTRKSSIKTPKIALDFYTMTVLRFRLVILCSKKQIQVLDYSPDVTCAIDSIFRLFKKINKKKGIFSDEDQNR
jgi:hypothetical protein